MFQGYCAYRIMENKNICWNDGGKMVSTISQEEENYVRISLLLSKICLRAVRALFDKEFHPSCLDATLKKAYNKLLKLKKSKVINTAEWNLLFPYHGRY